MQFVDPNLCLAFFIVGFFFGMSFFLSVFKGSK